jgi:hypothetical protein
MSHINYATQMKYENFSLSVLQEATLLHRKYVGICIFQGSITIFARI